MLCEQFELVALTAELEVVALLLLLVAVVLSLEAAGWLKLVALEDSAVESPLGFSVKDGMAVVLGQIAMPSMIHGRLGVGQTSEGSEGSGAIEVRVTVTTMVFVCFAAATVAEPSSCGKARALPSRRKRASIVGLKCQWVLLWLLALKRWRRSWKEEGAGWW
jgi:hypothetical protein